MQTSTWVAIVVGGTLGALLAVAMRPTSAPPPPKLAPVAAVPTESAPVEPPVAEGVPPPAAPEPAATPGNVPRKPHQAGVPDSPVASTGSSGNGAVSSIKSQEDLTRAEVACQEKRDPKACREAALAYEQGSVVPADPNKARLFRKIDLTFLVKQCEGQVPSACLDLAGRYERGDGVAKSKRSADALRTRFKELCAMRGGVGCPEP